MASVIVLTYISGQELEHLIAWSNSVFVVIYLMAMLAAAKLLPRHNWPLVALGCVFCVVLAFALGASMSYVLVLILVVAPFLWWQKSHIIRKQSLAIPESLLWPAGLKFSEYGSLFLSPYCAFGLIRCVWGRANQRCGEWFGLRTEIAARRRRLVATLRAIVVASAQG